MGGNQILDEIFCSRLKAIWLVLEGEIRQMELLLEIPDSVWTERMASLEDTWDFRTGSQDSLGSPLGFLASKTAFLDFKMDFQVLQVVLQVP